MFTIKPNSFYFKDASKNKIFLGTAQRINSKHRHVRDSIYTHHLYLFFKQIEPNSYEFYCCCTCN